MSEDNGQDGRRRKRVEWIKKGIILMLATVITVPLLLCVCVLVRLQNVNRTLKNISGQIESLVLITKEQQSQLERQAEALLNLSRKPAEEEGMQAKDEPELPDGGQEPDMLQPKETAENTGTAENTETAENAENAENVENAEIKAAHRVYLTFDDGPSVYTQTILDILDEYGVKATFFVVGKETDYAKEAMKRIVEDGHTLGMHSYSHKYLEVYASLDSFAEDLEKIQDYIYQVTGVESTVYRFPGGSSNTISKLPMENFARYLDEQGIVFFDWNVASGDGGVPLLPVETLVKNSMENLTRFETSVILMHDSSEKKTTVEALPAIIENILALEDTVILPITEDTRPVQHIHWSADASKHPTTEEGMEE